MTDPVTFATLPNGRIEALIGNTLVGYVSDFSIVLGSGSEAWFRLLMPVEGGPSAAIPTSTIAAAKRSLISKIADWHEQSDPVRYAVMIKQLRMQAEGERG